MAAARLAASMGSGGSIGEAGGEGAIEVDLWRFVKGGFMRWGGCLYGKVRSRFVCAGAARHLL